MSEHGYEQRRCPTCDFVDHRVIDCSDPFHSQHNDGERCEDCGEPLPHTSMTCIDKLNERRLFWQGRYQDTVIERDDLAARADALAEDIKAWRESLWDEVHRIGGPRKSELVKLGRQLDMFLWIDTPEKGKG